MYLLKGLLMCDLTKKSLYCQFLAMFVGSINIIFRGNYRRGISDKYDDDKTKCSLLHKLQIIFGMFFFLGGGGGGYISLFYELL